jgi:hypothetical protein
MLFCLSNGALARLVPTQGKFVNGKWQMVARIDVMHFVIPIGLRIGVHAIIWHENLRVSNKNAGEGAMPDEGAVRIAMLKSR